MNFYEVIGMRRFDWFIPGLRHTVSISKRITIRSVGEESITTSWFEHEYGLKRIVGFSGDDPAIYAVKDENAVRSLHTRGYSHWRCGWCGSGKVPLGIRGDNPAGHRKDTLMVRKDERR